MSNTLHPIRISHISQILIAKINDSNYARSRHCLLRQQQARKNPELTGENTRQHMGYCVYQFYDQSRP